MGKQGLDLVLEQEQHHMDNQAHLMAKVEQVHMDSQEQDFQEVIMANQDHLHHMDNLEH